MIHLKVISSHGTGGKQGELSKLYKTFCVLKYFVVNRTEKRGHTRVCVCVCLEQFIKITEQAPLNT